VSTIVLPDTPISGPLTPDRIADLIDQAAQLIEANGLEIGDLWPDALLRPYEPGDSCCTGGALAVVCGYRRAEDVEEAFTASIPTDEDLPWTPHPVFAAVMAELECVAPEHLYDWSDNSGQDSVVEALRGAAAAIRARGAVA
jgi:hypothetical protein